MSGVSSCDLVCGNQTRGFRYLDQKSITKSGESDMEKNKGESNCDGDLEKNQYNFMLNNHCLMIIVVI